MSTIYLTGHGGNVRGTANVLLPDGMKVYRLIHPKAESGKLMAYDVYEILRTQGSEYLRYDIEVAGEERHVQNYEFEQLGNNEFEYSQYAAHEGGAGMVTVGDPLLGVADAFCLRPRGLFPDDACCTGAPHTCGGILQKLHEIGCSILYIATCVPSGAPGRRGYGSENAPILGYVASSRDGISDEMWRLLRAGENDGNYEPAQRYFDSLPVQDRDALVHASPSITAWRMQETAREIIKSQGPGVFYQTITLYGLDKANWRAYEEAPDIKKVIDSEERKIVQQLKGALLQSGASAELVEWWKDMPTIMRVRITRRIAPLADFKEFLKAARGY
ncbi:hypothetical protein [Streptomyces sp. NPDC126514]|uniref:hypothetical protein n=1 Tax=Streptomyces sp. NPDC126514 TaxID=3155210 RepID=UPI0033323064